jgi:hypothetical protein
VMEALMTGSVGALRKTKGVYLAGPWVMRPVKVLDAWWCWYLYLTSQELCRRAVEVVVVVCSASARCGRLLPGWLSSAQLTGKSRDLECQSATLNVINV